MIMIIIDIIIIASIKLYVQRARFEVRSTILGTSFSTLSPDFPCVLNWHFPAPPLFHPELHIFFQAVLQGEHTYR